MSLKDLTRRAMALSPGAEGIKELLQECIRWDPVYKQKVYSAIAWSTGLTFGEIGELEQELRNEHREARRKQEPRLAGRGRIPMLGKALEPALILPLSMVKEKVQRWKGK